MPPKQKKGKANAPAIPLDEVDTTVLTLEKLQEFCVKFYDAFTKEKQYTEFLRLERDKLANLVAIATEQLTVLRNDIQEKEVELEDVKERHRCMMSELRKKVTNLASEKNIDYLNNKLETMRKNNQKQISHEKRLLEVQTDIAALKTQELDSERRFDEIKLKCQTELAEQKFEIRDKDTKSHLLTENKWEKATFSAIKYLELKFKEEYDNLNKKKDREIAQLLKYNTKCTTDLKNYYNKIVSHNMSVTTTMNMSFIDVRGTNGAIEKQLLKLRRENKCLRETLSQSKIKEGELHNKLKLSQKDKTELKRIKLELKEDYSILDSMKWELGALEIRLNKHIDEVRLEADEDRTLLFKKRAMYIENILVVEFIAKHLYHRNVESDSVLSKIKSIYKEKKKWHSLLDRISSEQDTTLDSVNFKLAGIVQKRARMVRDYESLLQRHGVHTDNTGFELLQVDDILSDATALRVLVDEDDIYTAVMV